MGDQDTPNHETIKNSMTLALLAIYSVFSISHPGNYTVPWGSLARREKMAAKALSIKALRYRTYILQSQIRANNKYYYCVFTIRTNLVSHIDHNNIIIYSNAVLVFASKVKVPNRVMEDQ